MGRSGGLGFLFHRIESNGRLRDTGEAEELERNRRRVPFSAEHERDQVRRGHEPNGVDRCDRGHEQPLGLQPVSLETLGVSLKAREDRIRKDIAEAEAARVKADESLKQYNARLVEADQKIQVLLGQAATDAEKIATSIKMRAQHDAEETKERATKEIESAKQAAIAEIYQQTAELATTIAEKIIRRSLNADDQRDLVKQSLDQLQSLNA